MSISRRSFITRALQSLGAWYVTRQLSPFGEAGQEAPTKHRTEGEIFWVIKHGSPGTGMAGFGNVLTDEEIWAIIQYERSFAGDHGPGMMGRGGEMGLMGPRGGMSHEGPPESKSDNCREGCGPGR